MSCDACLGRSTLTIRLARVARPDERPAVSRGELRDLRHACRDHAITALCTCEASYPAPLRLLADPPPVLYVRGDVHALDDAPRAALGIVGTRRPTAAGRDAARRIGAGWAASGGSVISGMALGIDGAAHDGALSVRGRTVAVLAGGVDRPTPGSHSRLYARILERGAVVGELPPGTAPRRWTFPARNRLIAALSEATLVVEAPHQSGALITVTHAQDLGRDVYAVPGSTAAPTCAGSNQMLVDGAQPMLDGADLAAVRGLAPTTGSGPEPETAAGRQLHAALGRGPRSVTELAAGMTTLGPGELELLLLDLELAGWIVRAGDGRYAQLTPAGT